LLDGVLHVWDQCCSILRFSKEPSIPIPKIFKNEELSNSILLNEKTRSRKQRPQGVLTKKEDATMVAWTLGMQECGLSITLHQFKMKVAKFIQTISTPFKDGIIRNN
jgi:hypothetical protein